MKGYKVFNPNMTCRGYQFELGKTYTHKGAIKICNSGFHFCVKASHCFQYYDFNPNNIVCEVEAIGEMQTHDEDSKVCTDKLHIIRQLTWDEVLQVANEGKNNTGHSNTGNSNTGNWNTGDRNTGDRNTGYSNTGDRNTGNRNTGDWNTGDRNTGYSNTGNRNTGNSNTGNRNTGDRNTGYSNTGNRNTGLFCTEEAPFPIFDMPTDWTEQSFKESMVYELMCEVDTKLWVPECAMNEEEKTAYPAYKTAGGYVKDIPFKEAFSDRWHNWNDINRRAFTGLPNFDATKFLHITGVDVTL